MATINGIIKKIAKESSLEHKQISRNIFVLSSKEGEVCKLEFKDAERTRLLVSTENILDGELNKIPVFFSENEKMDVKGDRFVYEKEIELNYPYDVDTYNLLRGEIDCLLFNASMRFTPENLFVNVKHTN